MEEISKRIESIIVGYKQLDKHILNIKEDISNLTNTHKKLLTTVEHKNEFNTFGFYIDDVYFHKTSLEHQLINIITLRNITFRKMYGDLFRLYVRITKKIAELDGQINEKEVDYVKEFHTDIKIKKFDELDNSNLYDYKDVNHILENIVNFIESLNKFVNDLSILIKKMDEKKREGYTVNTYIVGLSGEKSKLEVDINIAKKTLYMI